MYFLKFGIFQGFLQTNFEILLMSQKKTLFLEKKCTEKLNAYRLQ